MVHPKYAWMFFNWYNDNWWTNISCTRNDPEKKAAIENILLTSLIFDHYPRIDEKDRDIPNVGNIVSSDNVKTHNSAPDKNTYVAPGQVMS